MAFTVQNDDGDSVGANAYIDVSTFKEYHDDRQNEYDDFDDSEIQVAIIKATDFLDIRFQYIGTIKDSNQTTEFPRSGDDTIPTVIKEAVAEYAFRALSSELVSDPDFDTTGGKVKTKREHIGPIEEETEYFEFSGSEIPSYPSVDLRIERSGYVYSGSVGFLNR